MTDLFANDYDLGHLEKATTKRFGFDLFVTSRFKSRYVETVYEETTALFIRQNAKGVNTFIDVGAHYGFFDVLVGLSNPQCKILAFEPVPENCEILRKNLLLNHIDASVYQFAVSDRAGRASFQVSEASDNSGFIAHPSVGVVGNIETDVVQLDQYLPQIPDGPVLIKIDTEGNEIKVLHGMQKIIEKCSDLRLIIEFNPICLEANGASPQALLDTIFELGFDSFFIHNEERRYEKYHQGQEWRDFMGERTFGNLYCVKRNRPTNVLIFSHSSQLAGAEQSNLELVKELICDYGMICTVVLPSPGPLEVLLQQAGAATLIAPLNWWCAGTELPDNAKIHQLTNQSFGWLSRNLQVLRQINPDVVLTNTLVIPWGAVAASLLKRPHVWMINEFGELDHGLKFFLPFSQTLNFIDESSDKIVTCSKAIQKELFPHLDSNKIKTIYYSIDIPSKKSVSEVPKDSFFLIPDACHLIISGTVMQSKGQEDAVRAVIELIKNRNRRVELVIVGYAQSDFQNHLNEIINAEGVSDYIHIIPFQENVISIVNSADIVLVCSRMEGFGRVTLEAMLMEKAVIAANTGGTREMIFDGKTGLLYTPGNYIQLAGQIEKLLDNSNERLNLAHNAYQFVKKTFTKKKFGGEYYKMFVDLKNKEYQNKEKISWFITNQYQMILEQAQADVLALTGQMAEKEQSVQALTAQMVEKEQSVQALTAQMVEKERSVQALTTRAAEKEQSMQAIIAFTEIERDKLGDSLFQTQAELNNLKNQLQATNVYIQRKEQDIRIALSTLESIQAGFGWRLLQRFRTFTYRLAPVGSISRKIFDLIFRIARSLRRGVATKVNPASVNNTSIAEPITITAPQQIGDYAVCTIVSKNYLSFVRVFAHSMLKTNPGVSIYVLLVDRVDGAFDPAGEPFQVITLDELNNIPEPQNFEFKYTPIELNTAAKPYFLEYLFDKFNLKRVCYFDPDIYVFHSLQGLWDLLNGYSIILTPHITQPYTDDRKPSELEINLAGIFNLGFIGISDTQTSRAFLQWWKERMYDYCFMAPGAGMHVDQNWVNFAPVMRDGVFILRDPAYNLAYWNLHYRAKRMRFLSNERLLIDERPAIFFHFSGLPLDNLEKISKHQNRYTLSDLPNLRPLFEWYRDLLMENGYAETTKWDYAYGRFDNGVAIPHFARDLYNCLDKNQVRRLGNPFVAGGKDSFFAWLNQPADGNMAEQAITNLHMEIYRVRVDLQRIFPDPLGNNRRAFWNWIQDGVVRDHQLDQAFIPQPSEQDAATHRLYSRFSSKVMQLIVDTREVLKEPIKQVVGYNPKLFDAMRQFDRKLFFGQSVVSRAQRFTYVPPVSPSLPFGVNVAGYIQGEFGVAEVARASIRALESAELPYILNNVRTSVHRYEDNTYKKFSDENPYAFNLVHVNADQVPEFAIHKGRAYFENRCSIGYWFWELSKFPAQWRSSFDYFQEIWVASVFCQESIARLSPVPVVKMTFPILIDEATSVPDRSAFGLPEDKFLFLFSYDYLSVFERKNPLGVLQAFRTAFGHKNNCMLVLKSINSEHAPEQVAMLKKAAQGLNVHFLDGHVSRQQMMSLIASCDSYVSLHRSEGFGLGMAQAMYMGKPVIATGYSGNLEFMNHNNSFLVRYQLAELEQNYGPYQKGNIWAEPDIDHAAELMQIVYRNPIDVQRITNQGQLDIRTRRSPAIAGQEMAARLRQIFKD